ncbi:KpsF/GutQ family sugar-phosphate isomerase [Labilibaculum sp. A4]|uniref:KpsF/GutQ family sugar-phosphate isomerase n=1 Tax=Labilibaculum euxinus TaxID=2686357 RepID=A0A425YCW2_9BACT|nr:KpsF/GutQ family sugar-phosphate isomerase [Labilibaculum euxinus]MDQ1769910.1 KpsF/GutQ family sugar-phosphate isomerase [Labilibaculum euxinus]MUP37894.1 KpsF/GutQ family sugar-phosphate isomerase [Labilibaculum euxinus]MVB07099.1 KpsF/GutQ family sugar-phosphate isomerase [Labilibaculum euxinus]MWN76465.1 KpsF/GutQ family sugar-phosphate isomerase [Labilibaculum euxinus]
MKPTYDIKQIAIKTIAEEEKTVSQLKEYIDEDFVNTVELILKSKGRVVITGIGKSANIANKIVATLNSTGTPALFMHAADAIHGDLGMILPDDIIICISKSGSTPEIKVLVPLIKNMGNTLIAMVSGLDSFLAKESDYVLKAVVEKEADPNNLAPTNSTTAQLVIGDALAVSLLECRQFTSQDFAKYHPGGALGKKLYLRVSDLYKINLAPKVSEKENIRPIILEISSKRMGATAVVDKENKLVGIITDGDLRRMLEQNEDVSKLTARDIMSPKPKTIDPHSLAINAFQLMEDNNITQLAVVENEKYVGMVHLHDILKEGIV